MCVSLVIFARDFGGIYIYIHDMIFQKLNLEYIEERERILCSARFFFINFKFFSIKNNKITCKKNVFIASTKNLVVLKNV